MSAQVVQYWTEERCSAAGALAAGATYRDTAEQVGVSLRTIQNWMQNPVFAEEVDRLSTMIGIASRAERLRAAMRVLRAREDENGVLQSDKDSLDWLKFAQSETDGAKIDMSKLAELLAGESASDGPSGLSGPSQQLLASGAIETSAVESSGGNESSSLSQSDEDILINPS